MVHYSGYHGMVYSERPDDYIRIYNMHSTHAVLFVDDDCRKRVQSAIAQGRDKAVDVVTAHNMRFYRTYLLKRPFWYQNDGHHHRPTLEYYEHSGEPERPDSRGFWWYSQ